MRLWHIDLVKNGLLPKSQLVAQWRELNSIFKKQDKHILINYIYDYPKEYLYSYTMAVIKEMERRNFKIKSYENMNNYFGKDIQFNTKLKFKEHNEDYFEICYFNLKEKYLRGQKNFTEEIIDKLFDYYIMISG